MLREMKRLTRSPEKLASAGARCWTATFGRKRSLWTHRPPYPTRRRLVTAWQKTKKLLQDEIWIETTSICKRPKTNEVWRAESCESIIVGSYPTKERREEEKEEEGSNDL